MLGSDLTKCLLPSLMIEREMPAADSSYWARQLVQRTSQNPTLVRRLPTRCGILIVCITSIETAGKHITSSMVIAVLRSTIISREECLHRCLKSLRPTNIGDCENASSLSLTCRKYIIILLSCSCTCLYKQEELVLHQFKAIYKTLSRVRGLNVAV